MTQNAVTIIGMVLAAIPPTIASLAALRQAKINAVKTDEVSAKADTATVRAEELSVKTDELVSNTSNIHELANSNLTAMTDNFKEATARILALEKQVLTLLGVGKRVP